MASTADAAAPSLSQRNEPDTCTNCSVGGARTVTTPSLVSVVSGASSRDARLTVASRSATCSSTAMHCAIHAGSATQSSGTASSGTSVTSARPASLDESTRSLASTALRPNAIVANANHADELCAAASATRRNVVGCSRAHVGCAPSTCVKIARSEVKIFCVRVMSRRRRRRQSFRCRRCRHCFSFFSFCVVACPAVCCVVGGWVSLLATTPFAGRKQICHASSVDAVCARLRRNGAASVD